MYSYFFLISLVKCPITDFEGYSLMVGKEYRRLISEKKLDIIFGEKCKSNSQGYGFGEQEKLLPTLFYFCNLFPESVFAIYHFYFNCQYLSVYTFSKEDVSIHRHNLSEIKIGEYSFCSSYSLKNTQINNNITNYLNPNYEYYL